MCHCNGINLCTTCPVPCSRWRCLCVFHIPTVVFFCIFLCLSMFLVCLGPKFPSQSLLSLPFCASGTSLRPCSFWCLLSSGFVPKAVPLPKPPTSPPCNEFVVRTHEQSEDGLPVPPQHGLSSHKRTLGMANHGNSRAPCYFASSVTVDLNFCQCLPMKPPFPRRTSGLIWPQTTSCS